MSFDEETFFHMLSSIEKDHYDFKDFIVTLHACTVADTMRDAMNAWLGFKNSIQDDFLGKAIDACMFYHLRKVAISMGKNDDAEDFLQRMVALWNSEDSDANDIDSVTQVDEICIDLP